jgi:hypothetical protein
VALLRGEYGPRARCSCWETINEELGPFYIGLGRRGDGGDCSCVRVGEGLGYGSSGQLELVKRDIWASDCQQVTLCCLPDGRDVDLLVQRCCKSFIDKAIYLHWLRPEGVHGLSLG